jgi:hypothetical protein
LAFNPNGTLENDEISLKIFILFLFILFIYLFIYLFLKKTNRVEVPVGNKVTTARPTTLGLLTHGRVTTITLPWVWW